MRWTMEFVVLTLAMTAAAWFTGWWSLPVLAAGYGVWAASHKTVVLTAAIAGAASWGALLAYTASQGPAARLSDVFSVTFHLPHGALAILTLAFPALLGAAAAAFARGVRRLASPV